MGLLQSFGFQAAGQKTPSGFSVRGQSLSFEGL